VELHQLRYLVAVVEEGSFTRAAAREHVAQPAVSSAVRRLERELGVDLRAVRARCELPDERVALDARRTEARLVPPDVVDDAVAVLGLDSGAVLVERQDQWKY
jgi:DNA-binding transcriptional LysR family regulator